MTTTTILNLKHNDVDLALDPYLFTSDQRSITSISPPKSYMTLKTTGNKVSTVKTIVPQIYFNDISP